MLSETSNCHRFALMWGCARFGEFLAVLQRAGVNVSIVMLLQDAHELAQIRLKRVHPRTT